MKLLTVIVPFKHKYRNSVCHLPDAGFSVKVVNHPMYGWRFLNFNPSYSNAATEGYHTQFLSNQETLMNTQQEVTKK